MSAALSASALLMGLASSPHCVAMCGSACGGVASACGAGRPQRAMAALQLGRLFSYSAMGALVAASVSALGAWSSGTPAVRPLWSAIHLAALGLGIWLLWRGRVPDTLRLFGRRLTSAVQRRGLRAGLAMAAASGPDSASGPGSASSSGSASGPGSASSSGSPAGQGRGVDQATGSGSAAGSGLPARSAGRWWHAGLLGSVWVALPCGLLQAALVVASLADGAVQGAAVMASFAVGSGLGLWAGPSLWWRFSGGRLNAATGPLTAARLGGATLVGLSAWALGHGLWERVYAALC